MGHAEVAPDVLVDLVALLVADEDRAPAVDLAEAADDGRVVAEQPVAVQLDDIGRHGAQQLERVRPMDVACELDACPDGVAQLVLVDRKRWRLANRHGYGSLRADGGLLSHGRTPWARAR